MSFGWRILIVDAGHLGIEIVLADAGHLERLIRLFRAARVGLGTHVRRWCLVGWEPTQVQSGGQVQQVQSMAEHWIGLL